MSIVVSLATARPSLGSTSMISLVLMRFETSSSVSPAATSSISCPVGSVGEGGAVPVRPSAKACFASGDHQHRALCEASLLLEIGADLKRVADPIGFQPWLAGQHDSRNLAAVDQVIGGQFGRLVHVRHQFVGYLLVLLLAPVLVDI